MATLPIIWRLTQQLLANAKALFTHRFTSAVLKHSVFPSHNQTTEKITRWPTPTVIAVFFEWIQAGCVGVCSYSMTRFCKEGDMSWQPQLN